MTFTNEQWARRQECSDSDRRAYERERLILWTTEAISELMESSGFSKAELAKRLETSRANITQVLSGSRNATLNTVADLAWALGKRAVVKFEPLRVGQFISSPVHLVGSPNPKLVMIRDSTAGETFGGSDELDFIPARVGAV